MSRFHNTIKIDKDKSIRMKREEKVEKIEKLIDKEM